MGVTLIRHTQADVSHPSVDEGAPYGELRLGGAGEVDATDVGDVHPESDRGAPAVGKTGLRRYIEAFDDDVEDRPGPNGLPAWVRNRPERKPHSGARPVAARS